MRNDFQVSVVIPTYNREPVVGRAIQSVLDQTLQPREIIVVDDGSIDATQAFLASFNEKITIVTLAENRGVSFARNRGIETAKGAWIALLDSDDYWEKTKLEQQAEYHSENPALRISQCDEVWVRNGRRVNPRKKHRKRGGWIFPACLPLCIVSPSAVIFQKALWSEMGGFDEGLQVCEDYDLWLRIARKYPIGFLDESLIVKIGGHQDQLSQAYPAMDRYRIYAMEKHLDEELSPAWRKALVTELEVKCKIVSQGAEKRRNSALARAYGRKWEEYTALLDSLEKKST
ncbi:MAG: glycosyltransferase [Candidatus Marinimicrobia bacterium]|nr:glycosyltransferase [Candidatus Neomarinimicrobiota bacterium]MCF7839874.1 glycosyltransferase [Candidatus Neomarinimicrobiota bacterium]MCF7902662.1 glycosyltransferase [Candidatus Neomarinimicrobiota bacterium]